MDYGLQPSTETLSLEQLVRAFNLEHVRGGYSLLDKLETTAENQTYRYDGLEFAKLFASKKLESLPILTRRANSKALSSKLSFALLQTNSKLTNAYARTFHCANYVVSEQGRYKSKYCHNRWCLTCGRIKTAKYINDYKPILSSFTDKRLVTLTHRNPDGPNLRACIDQMGRDWRKITDLARKQNRQFKGIRKLECTYNRDQNTYHPHFHIVVDGKQNAVWLIERWIALDPFNRKIQGQDERMADDGSLKELFKYFTKLTTNSSKDPNITIPAINHIFEVIKGKRVFQSFGFVQKNELIKQIGILEYEQRNSEQMEILVATKKFLDENIHEKAVAYDWDPIIANWVNHADSDILTPYRQTKKLLHFEKLFLYETGNNAAFNRPNNAGHTNTNRGFVALCPGLVERDTGPPENMAEAETSYNIQKRPPGD